MVGVIVITDEDHVNECGRWSVSLSSQMRIVLSNIEDGELHDQLRSYEDRVIECGGEKSLFCFQHLKSTKGSN